jgi:hypothetical protein
MPDHPPIGIGAIPDLTKTNLYFVVVMETRDDPRLLMLWCCYAIWQQADWATGHHARAAEWAARSGLADEMIVPLTQTLIERGFLTRPGLIPHWTLQEMSRDRYTGAMTDMLRVQVGLAPIYEQQRIEHDG